MKNVIILFVILICHLKIVGQLQVPEELNSINWNDTTLNTSYEDFITNFFS